MSSPAFLIVAGHAQGGVGKTIVAALLAQFIGPNVCSADTDVLTSFCRFKKLNVKHIDILRENFNIDKRRFDEIFNAVADTKHDYVVDISPAVFFPLVAYLIEGDMIDCLKAMGKRVVIHVILCAGPTWDSTLYQLDRLSKILLAPIVVWENRFFGAVEKNGMQFSMTSTFERHRNKILGVVSIPYVWGDAHVEEIVRMFSLGLTFDEIDEHFTKMACRRIRRVRSKIFGQLELLNL